MLILSAALVMSEDVQLQFNWAFVKRALNGSPRAIDFSEKVAISPGDLFKIIIQPVKNAFIYLFLLDASENLQLLFPDRFTDFDSLSYLNAQTFIPTGENWFTLDSAQGTERFYLLASYKRLSSLESLTLAYQKAAKGKNSPDAARQAVLDEISRLRRAYSQLTTAAEKPVTIAGGTRGANEAAAKLATQIEASNYYTKTFRLEH
jgi:hypothetical protein